MKKNLMKTLALTLAVASLSVAAISFAACGETDVSGTYKYSMDADDVAGNLYNNGFLVAVSATQENTLVLDATTMTYTLTKEVTAPANSVDLKYVFTGTYTNDGYEVTLSKATDCTFDEAWGDFIATGYLKNTSGQASKGDMANSSGDTMNDPLLYFSTPYWNYGATDGNQETKVTVNTDGSFTYVITGSSDDE